jgi:hypothetical protein
LFPEKSTWTAQKLEKKNNKSFSSKICIFLIFNVQDRKSERERERENKKENKHCN